MYISFSNRKFAKLVNDDRKLSKEMGKIRAEKIKSRLAQLRDANSLEDLRNLPGTYHELVGNRKGQWSCDLDQPYRLIFTPQENPIPVNDDGNYLWLEIKGVEIIEIVNYHKER